MKKFATKVASVVVAFSLFAGQVAAVTPAISGDTFYPNVPEVGMRLWLYADTNGIDNLADAYFDLTYRNADETLYDAGTLYVYGNDKDDTNDKNYYNEWWTEFAGGFNEYGVILMNSSNTNKVVYNMMYDDGVNVYDYTETTKTPGTSLSSVRNLLQKEAIKDLTPNDFASVDAGLTDVLDSFIDTSLVKKGDPDVMTDYFDQVWVYINDGVNEYAWHFDVELADALQDTETAEVDDVKVVTRGVHGRVDITPGDMDGVTGWLVEIVGTGWNDQIATQYPVVFFTPTMAEDYDVTVYTLNAEGDKSEDGVEVEEMESERIDMEDYLPDMDEDNIFYNHVQYLYKLGIVDGYSNGDYGPGDDVSRGQLAKFVMNTFKLPFNLGGEMFSDVEMDNVFFPYIQSLKNAGVVSGFSDGTFKPADDVTRGQAMKYVHLAATYYDEDAVDDTSSCSFGDYSTFGVFASNICSIAEHVDSDEFQPIVGGYSNGDFGPNDTLTRGQMSKIMLHAGAMIDGDVAGNAFIFVGGFDRVFVAPIDVEDFDDTAVAANQVDLAWDDLAGVDGSIDGYLIGRREVGDEKWDDLNGVDTSVDGVLPTVPQAFVDNDADKDTRYEYRIAAFKWIPVDYSNDDYAGGQGAMEADTDEWTNMVIGPWTTITVKTPKV